MTTTPNSSQNELVVLMPARNEAHQLPAAIQGVSQSRNLDSQDVSMLVCANASTDHSLRVLQHLKNQNKKLDFITENVPGKPRALNALIDKTETTKRMGSDDVVVFLDANARVQPETLSQLSGALKRNRRLNAVSANDVASAPVQGNVLDHLLFGISDISLSSLALRDRKASCTAVRASKVKGMRFPEHVIADDLWLTMYLGVDSTDVHPDAFVSVPGTRSFFDFAANSVRHMMGMYQLGEFFDRTQVNETFSSGIHEHVGALLTEEELQDQFAQLPATYKLGTILAFPIHAALKTAAWIGYHVTPHSTERTRKSPAVSRNVTRSPSTA